MRGEAGDLGGIDTGPVVGVEDKITGVKVS